MKTNKILPIVFVIAFALVVIAQNESVSVYDARVLLSCPLEFNENGFNEKDCELAVGNLVFEISVKSDEDAREERLVFPLGDTYNVYPREQINCLEPEQISVAKYDNGWKLIDSDVKKLEGSAYKVSALISEPGYYAVVRKDVSLVNEGEKYCIPLECGTYTAHITSPYTAKIKAGQSIVFDFCGLSVPGCYPNPNDGYCDENCIEGMDANCDISCTNEGGDCCKPDLDGVCDEDCWQRTDEDGNIIEAFDPDCVYQGAPLEKPKIKWEELGNFEIGQQYGRHEGATTWKLIEIDFDQPKIIDGRVKFNVLNDENRGVWFANFTYTDMFGKEHTLFPLQPIPVDAYTINPGRFTFGSFKDNIVWIYSYAFVFPLQPFIWYQTDKDTTQDNFYKHQDLISLETERTSGKDYGKTQFYLPPTGIKKIKFYASLDEPDRVYSEPVQVKVTAEVWDTVADEDNDNYTRFEDCNDENPLINPGAEERCNFIDDNCNAFFNIDNSGSYKQLYIGRKYDYNEVEENPIAYADWDALVGYTNYFTMPCDGFVQFEHVDGPVYMEIWEKEPFLGLARPVGIKPCKYFDSVASHVTKDECSASIDATSVNGPWQIYQAILAKEDDIDCGANHGSIGCGAGGNDGDDSGGNAGCIIGSHASCRIGALPDSCEYKLSIPVDEKTVYFNRYGQQLLTDDNVEEGALSSDFIQENLNAIDKRLELKEGEMIWAKAYYGCGGAGACYYCDSGSLEFEVYCYKQQEPNFTLGVTVDENANCDIHRESKIFVCKTDRFDDGRCLDDEYCSFSSTEDNGNCDYTAPTMDFNNKNPYYAYKCTYYNSCESDDDCHIGECIDNKCAECGLFYSSEFRICTEKEVCDYRINLDQDCDGLTPFDVKEDGSVDKTKPLDPDCENAVMEGECDPVEQKWFHDGRWITENYCKACYKYDSTCTKTCAEGEASCDGGCLPETCDVSAKKWCKQGIWVDDNYCNKCGLKDASCYSQLNSCTGATCDVQANAICLGNNWITGDSYCKSECSKIDSNCTAVCEENSCDVYANKYCENSEWLSVNYCSKCGAIDADCGFGPCEDNKCDVNAKKVCQDGLWIEPNKDDYCFKWKCAEQDLTYCECIKTEEDKELTCDDRIDNDCDGFTDCRDSDCRDVERCKAGKCNPGETRKCQPDEWIENGYCFDDDSCWCLSGTQTCDDDGYWGECAGYTGPNAEICNGIDDNCDNSVDERCVCKDGEVKECGKNGGGCSSGIQECKNGKWGFCFGDSFSTATFEVCDGYDNDCDGSIDEDCPCIVGETQECGTNSGICHNGTQVCEVGGTWGDCVGAIEPMKEGPEACNDLLDNDCDNKTDLDDEGCRATPYNQRAATCYDGIQNQGEEMIDCGGPCEPCERATCNDGKQNNDEEGIDCGGSCNVVCVNGRAGTEEPMQDIEETECGNNVCEDGEDETCPEDCIFSICGDGYCDFDEDEVNCKEDCAEKSSFGSILTVLIVILIVAIGLFFGYKKGLIKIKGKPAKPKQLPPMKSKPNIPPTIKPVTGYKPFNVKPKKSFKTKEELELEKSFKEHEKLIKKG